MSKLNRRFPWLLLIALLLPILASCGGGGGTPTQATTAPGTGTESTAAPAAEPTTAAEVPTTVMTEAPAETMAPEATTEGGAMEETATAGAMTEETATTGAMEETATTGAMDETATAGAMTEETATTSAGGGTSTISKPTDLSKEYDGQTITYISGATQVSADFANRMAQEFKELTGVTVNVLRGPDSATERLAQYLQQLGAQSTDIDVYEIDVIWPGILAQHAVDLGPMVQESGVTYFDRIVKNNTVDGKLVGVPYFTDAGLLYYRKDLLEKYKIANPPATWQELETQAKTIQDGERGSNADFWGYVWQGAAYEGLTCNALEWQVSNGGGSIVEPDGTISINNEQAAAALDRAKGWVGTISPPGVTTYKEEDARGVWQAGNAAFMRNWPYAYSSGQAADSVIKDKFDVTLVPKGDGPNAQNADTLGGWQLMVSNYSQHKEAATEFVKFLASPYGQQQRAIELSNLPTIAEVYTDPEVVAKNPFYPRLLPVFQGGAVPRPSTVTGELYNDVSSAYFSAVNQVLTGQIDGATAVANLQTDIEDILAK